MPIVGIVGGLGPPSTIDYYQRILAAWARIDPATAPSIVIDSLDVQLGLRLAASDRDGLTAYLGKSIARLAGASVDFIAMTANTAHLVFDELAATSPVPLVSIVETAADEAARRQLKRLALLGTRFTMEGDFYPRVFARRGIEIVSPAADDQSWIHDHYIRELLKSNFRDDTRLGVIERIARMRECDAIDGVILGGTELPLLLRDEVVAGIPTLDTTALHVDAIVARLRS